MEFVLFAILLVIVVLVWGLSSISQSYAAARQAQASIEASRAAQIASTGNLVTILAVVLVILALLAIIGFALWLFYQVRIKPLLTRSGLYPAYGSRRSFAPREQAGLPGQDPLGLMTQMMAFQMYRQIQADLHQQQREGSAVLEDDGDDRWLLPG